ncbi:MAG: hypothetical protein M3261_07330 [Thermoproteota archaeon]|nr:hypothetical protein [Thermoproteota archaeon]
MAITRAIPPLTNSNSGKLGQAINYGNYFALANLFNGYVLLSGGPSVRSSVTVIGTDEKWVIGSIGGAGGAVKYGDQVTLGLPNYNNKLLSGGPGGMRTTTTNRGTDETWQIQSLYFDRTGQAVQYGDLVIFSMPSYNGLLLSGGPSVRTGTTVVNRDEAWLIVCPT